MKERYKYLISCLIVIFFGTIYLNTGGRSISINEFLFFIPSVFLSTGILAMFFILIIGGENNG